MNSQDESCMNKMEHVNQESKARSKKIILSPDI